MEQSDTLMLPPLPPTTGLEIYDVRGIPPDTLLSAASLVGLVNRGPAKIYLIENDDDVFWLEQLDPALPCRRPALVGEMLLDHLLSTYREQLAGLVIYDPAVPDTRNVATTLAGLRAGLVVSPEQAGRLQAAPLSLPVLADLRVHGWKYGLQAYAWAYKHLRANCSPDLVAGLDPRLCGGLRSFLVTQRVFTCWLDARKLLPLPSAGWYSERSLFKRLLSTYHAGAVHLGWFVSEPLGIRLTSRTALLTLASDHCTNLAAWSSLPLSAPSTDEPESETRLQKRGEPTSPSAEDDGRTTYLSFTISDGDNLQYCQHYLLRLWRDPRRGSLPLGWTIAPALWQAMPRLAAFYRRTATANDVLIAGPSGGAYILPSCWPREQRAAFLRLTGTVLQAANLEYVQILDSRAGFSMKFLDPALQELFAGELASYGVRGIFSGAGSLFPSWRLRAGLPVYQNLGLALNPQYTLRLIQGAMAQGKRFINVYIFAWNLGLGDLQNIVQQLGDRVRVVSPARLLEMIEQNEQSERIRSHEAESGVAGSAGEER